MKKFKSLKGEVWKLLFPLAQLQNRKYYISNKARLKSVSIDTKSERLIKTRPDRHGHLRTKVFLKDGKVVPVWIHKEVAKHFVKKPSRAHTLVVHKNFKKEDNKVNNLIWVTPEEHKLYIQRKRKKMGYVRPKREPKGKLTPKQVAVIKKLLIQGKKRRYKIAEKYGVSVTQLKRIERGENWGDVKPAK